MSTAHVMAVAGTGALASGGGSFPAPVGVMLAIFVPVCAAVAVIVWGYHRLQRHRADAAAMAGYRELAGEAAANMAGMRAEMARLSDHVTAVGQLMRDVG